MVIYSERCYVAHINMCNVTLYMHPLVAGYWDLQHAVAWDTVNSPKLEAEHRWRGMCVMMCALLGGRGSMHTESGT